MKILISIFEGLKLAFRSILANKMRAALTMFGIIIGIISVTAMQTMIDGVNRGLDNSLSMMGRNVVFVQKWPWGFGGEYKWWEFVNRPEMKPEYAQKIKEYSRYASDVSVVIGRNVSIRFKDLDTQVEMQGVSANYASMSGMNLVEGRFFTEEDDASGRQVVILGGTVAEQLFPNAYPIGKIVRVDGLKYRVLGVLEKQGKFLGLEDTDNRILMPFGAYKKSYPIRWGLTLKVGFPSEEAFEEGKYELEGVMRRVRQLDALDDNDFAINKPEAFKEAFNNMTFAIYGVGIFLTSLSLFVGGIGVMNIMFVSVKERTREIGIRKAVGAKFWEIMLQFQTEAVVVTLLGGLVGMLFSLGITQLINQFFVAYMDWNTVVWAVSICAGVGILFGFLPAYSAAKSDPISAIRAD